ncbi:unnamed protein product, partial [Tetraodon nigroviridis]
TTILAATFSGGVVIGSDSRASMGGEYVSSKTINKVIKVHDRIFCCMAGSLADAQAVTKAAKFQLSFHRSHTSKPVFKQDNPALTLWSFCPLQHPDGDPPSGHLGSLCAERAVLPKQGGAAGRLHHGWLGQQGRATGTEGLGTEAEPSHTFTVPQVYVVSLGGMLLRQPVTIGGSGSTFIYGYVDAKYKPNMSREECLQFATN